MYLSDRDLSWAIETGKLLCDPRPEKIDANSIDLHLDSASEARIWNIQGFMQDQVDQGRDRPELRIAQYKLASFSSRYCTSPPNYSADPGQLVGMRGNEIVVKPQGFLLWQTKETVGTPSQNADLICFVDGKSTRARAGIVVHLTAPTIHTSWSGKITLEIYNAGPFDIVLQENDVIGQIIVARITSSPQKTLGNPSVTVGQTEVGGTRR